MSNSIKAFGYWFLAFLLEVLNILIRPTIIYFIWNYGVAFQKPEMKIEPHQILCMLLIYHLVLSYVPVNIIKYVPVSQLKDLLPEKEKEENDN